MTLCRPVSSADADLEERLARDKALQRATAVSQRVGRLLLKAESGELALVDQLAQELLESEYRRAQSCPARASARLSRKRPAPRHEACSAPGLSKQGACLARFLLCRLLTTGTWTAASNRCAERAVRQQRRCRARASAATACSATGNTGRRATDPNPTLA